MYRLDYKGVWGNQAVARFNTIEDAQAWITERLRKGYRITNPKLTKE